MRIVSPTLRIVARLLLAALLSIVGYQVFLRTSQAPEALLKRADDLSWLNSWIAAEPLYHRAELEFVQKGDLSKALYARVSQVPAQSESSTSIPSQIAVLRSDLDRPEAREPETRLRILTILGMLETNYDAGMARQTWSEVEALANRRHHHLLASRAGCRSVPKDKWQLNPQSNRYSICGVCNHGLRIFLCACPSSHPLVWLLQKAGAAS